MRVLMFVHKQSVFFVFPNFKIDAKLSFSVTVWSIHTNEDVFLNQYFFSAKTIEAHNVRKCTNVRWS